MPKIKEKDEQSYLAIDPGQEGGIAVLWSGGAILTRSMPETELEMWGAIDGNTSYRTIGVIEKVHSMPKQGVASSFKFGMNYGLARMALIGSGIPWEEVTPQAWQKGLRIPPKGKDEEKAAFKLRLLQVCQRLYPKMELWKEPRSKGKQLAICDALLIATWLKRRHEGTL